MDNPIHPALEIPECDLAHLGYLTEADRRFKCLARNFAMLELDRQFYPGRKLTDVLYARDHINFAIWDMGINGGKLTPMAERHCWAVVRLYRNGEWYNNPRHLYFRLMFGFYQKALNLLKAGMEFQIQGEDGNNLRFLTVEEFVGYTKAMIDVKADELRYDYPELPVAHIPEGEAPIPDRIYEFPLPALGKLVEEITV